MVIRQAHINCIAAYMYTQPALTNESDKKKNQNYLLTIEDQKSIAINHPNHTKSLQPHSHRPLAGDRFIFYRDFHTSIALRRSGILSMLI